MSGTATARAYLDGENAVLISRFTVADEIADALHTDPDTYHTAPQTVAVPYRTFADHRFDCGHRSAYRQGDAVTRHDLVDDARDVMPSLLRHYGEDLFDFKQTRIAVHQEVESGDLAGIRSAESVEDLVDHLGPTGLADALSDVDPGRYMDIDAFVDAVTVEIDIERSGHGDEHGRYRRDR